MNKRKEEERAERRELIVRGARKCFFTYGLKGTTMESIARECRLAKGTLYLYFSGKEDLYAALVEEGQRLLNEAVRAAAKEAEGDIERQLLEMSETFCRFAQTDREYFRILMMIDYDLLSVRVEAEKLERISALQEEAFRLIESLYLKAIDRGLFPASTDIRRAVWSCLAMLHGGILLREKSRKKLPLLADINSETFIGELMQLMLAALRAGLIVQETGD